MPEKEADEILSMLTSEEKQELFRFLTEEKLKLAC